MIVPNIGGGGAVRHIQRGISSSSATYMNTQTIALSGFKNLDKMFVEVESGVLDHSGTSSAHISEFSLTSMTLTTPTPVMYQVIEFT